MMRLQLSSFSCQCKKVMPPTLGNPMRCAINGAMASLQMFASLKRWVKPALDAKLTQPMRRTAYQCALT